MILVIHACAQGSLCGSTIERLRAEAEHISSPTRSLITFLSNLISLRHAKFRLRADSNVLETCRDRFERHGRQTSQDPIDRSHRRSLVFRRALSASTSQPFDRLKAGLRAAEIAKLSWDMVLGPSGEVGVTIELQDKIAKKGSGRSIPLHRHSRGTHRGTAALPRSGSGYPVGARWRHDADEHRRLVQPAKTTQRHLLRS